VAETVQERVEAVERRIGAACARAGRPRDAVQLLPVSKAFGPEAVTEMARCGLAVFGESRVQEARAKIPACPSHLHWHLIGHLQSNKVKAAVELFEMIHAVDSVRLLEMIERACEEQGRTLRVCLEVNAAGERTKFGLSPEGVREAVAAANRLFRVQVVGLMTVPPVAREPEAGRPYFRALRELRDALQKDTGVALPELSMGMSSDFEVAIEEGATWVRVGGLLFGPRVRVVVSDDSA